ncbi:hypothetical protein FH972_020297 [Carpinus fangiana]|uniref:Uncharacterized protein n=1 Tax=Carpinus fangiana TaxID=176857 RepID=A0A5N6RSR8_9ROSI|nr:hypothetical protein FH972_020297 [Carpinus fangiana]
MIIVVKYTEIFRQAYISVFYYEIERMEDMEIKESEAKGVKSGRDTYRVNQCKGSHQSFMKTDGNAMKLEILEVKGSHQSLMKMDGKAIKLEILEVYGCLLFFR